MILLQFENGEWCYCHEHTVVAVLKNKQPVDVSACQLNSGARIEIDNKSMIVLSVTRGGRAEEVFDNFVKVYVNKNQIISTGGERRSPDGYKYMVTEKHRDAASRIKREAEKNATRLSHEFGCHVPVKFSALEEMLALCIPDQSQRIKELQDECSSWRSLVNEAERAMGIDRLASEPDMRFLVDVCTSAVKKMKQYNLEMAR